MSCMQLEEQITEIEQFYRFINVQVNNVKDKTHEKHVIGTKRSIQGSSSREANSSNTMQEITQHKWAWPFMDPVDVEGLGLHDYYEIIEKPMDFSTVKRKMDAKDGSGYQNVREIYADVRLIFKNAMKYNDEKHDIHTMAKTLLEKFEKKWLQLLPKVAQALCNIEATLENFKEMVIEKCRKISTREKVILMESLPRLTLENLSKAMQIISANDPTFQPFAQEVNLDLDVQLLCLASALELLTNLTSFSE
ncbi:hypothetical protein Fmac_009676 [Flemingia macrophylla]|uniref:Bromo domain-containing protein n=1 Tax=Flemingia macrophylla TaxID=520843 RepID=A0ABD1N0Y1_9FABA